MTMCAWWIRALSLYEKMKIEERSFWAYSDVDYSTGPRLTVVKNTESALTISQLQVLKTRTRERE